jgi:hypothetical protein
MQGVRKRKRSKCTLIVYSQIYVKIYIKNRGETALIEKGVYKNVLQRAGWALPKPFFVFTIFSHNKKIPKTGPDGHCLGLFGI